MSTVSINYKWKEKRMIIIIKNTQAFPENKISIKSASNKLYTHTHTRTRENVVFR